MRTASLHREIRATIKRRLTQQGIGYRELGTKIGLTESGVKKCLNRDDLSLTRLDEIANALGLPLVELLSSALGPQETLVRLTGAQEEVLTSDRSTFRLFVRIVHQGLSIDDVVKLDQWSRGDIAPHLKKLEHVGLLRRSGDRVESAVGTHPMLAGTKAFTRATKLWLLDGVFIRAKEQEPKFLTVRYYRASRTTLERVRKRIEELLEDTDRVAASDVRLLPKSDLEQLSVGVLMVADDPFPPAHPGPRPLAR